MNATPTNEAKLREALVKTTHELAELIVDERDDPSVGIFGWAELHQLVANNRNLLAALTPHLAPGEPTDAELLDWLEKPRGTVVGFPVNPFRDVVHRINAGLSVRAAIKAAMKPTP